MKSKNKFQINDIAYKWKGSTLHDESTLHQISPYIGKMKSSMARALITTFSNENDTIYDPYCGSGSVALEAWSTGRNVIANDLSPYAATITRAKLFPYFEIDKVLFEIDKVELKVKSLIKEVDLRSIPIWVRSFFHPETLREAIVWVKILKAKKSYFLLSCLLGILHHQRPGFLSYPSSHTVPYLKEKKFPRSQYPEMYQYRSIRERLERKVIRMLKRIPRLNSKIIRKCYMRKTEKLIPEQKVNEIITSPPYMRQLSYGRDNRLRLWFLGLKDWKQLDNQISPSENDFITHCKACFKIWHKVLVPKGICVLVLGEIRSRVYNISLPDVVSHIAINEVGGYSVLCKYTEAIPNERRVRRGCLGSMHETVLVLQRIR